MSATPSVARRRRIITLLNAILDLQEGDLLAVLELDRVTPLTELGENDTFQVGEDGKIVWTPGTPPPPKSLKHRAQTGKDLAHILEDHLNSVLVFGEVSVPSYKKRKRGKKELGGRVSASSGSGRVYGFSHELSDGLMLKLRQPARGVSSHAVLATGNSLFLC
jgi:hypothetical protein